MSNLINLFASSIGNKILMALTGFFLLVFLLEHLVGNLLLIAGEVPFLQYAEWMGAGFNIPIRLMEVMLFLGFAAHIAQGVTVAKRNRQAHPIRYAAQGSRTHSTWFSRHMYGTGLVLLAFLILHLTTFFIDARFGLDVGIGIDSAAYIQPTDLVVDGHVLVATGETNLYQKAVAHFSIWWYTAIYVLAMLILAFHLRHGVHSAFQTMGWRHPTWTPVMRRLGTLYAIGVPVGFATIPLYFLIRA